MKQHHFLGATTLYQPANGITPLGSFAMPDEGLLSRPFELTPGSRTVSSSADWY
jgi:hypothetical protein